MGFPPGAQALIGHAAIHEVTVEYVRAGVKRFRMDTMRCYGNEAMIVDQSTYVMTYGPDDVVDRGKYLNVWKPEDGSWRNRANNWNSSS